MVAPLAERLRPATLDQVIGQQHLLGLAVHRARGGWGRGVCGAGVGGHGGRGFPIRSGGQRIALGG